MPGLHAVQGQNNATEVLCLMNMITEEELLDDEEYEGLFLIKILNHIMSHNLSESFFYYFYVKFYNIFRYHGRCERRMYQIWTC